MEITERWTAAQTIEANYWRHYEATEIVKQNVYLKMMKLPEQFIGTVIDFGGGPHSLLLREDIEEASITVVDPIEAGLCAERYAEAGIEFENIPAEDYSKKLVADTALLYNVLQHVKDPARVLQVAWDSLKFGGALYLCEFIGIPEGKLGTNYFDCHPWYMRLRPEDQHPGAPENHHPFDLLPAVEALPNVEVVRCDRFRDPHPWLRHNWVVLKLHKKHDAPAIVKIKPRRSLRFHLLGIPHTQTSPEWCACAYTMKVFNMAKMLKRMGHEVIHYGSEGSTVECDEQVDIVPKAMLDAFYSTWDWKQRTFPGYDTEGAVFWAHAARVTPEKLQKRITGQHDIILSTFGSAQANQCPPLENGLVKGSGAKVVESGVGYKGIWTGYCCFETYAWMAFCMSWAHRKSWGRNYDNVIWNYYDLNDFTYRDKTQKEDYALFIARNTMDKGLMIAVEATAAMGIKLKVAGQRCNERGELFVPQAFEFPHVEHVGYVGVRERDKLMGSAKFLMMPTTYWEPFGGVVVEANLCGTPVITTDWGAFQETVKHGETGFRCRTMQDFREAISRIDEIDSAACRAWAADHSSLEVATEKYDDWYQRIACTMLGDPGYHAYNDGGPYSLEGIG